jgi:hypothetical protein
MNFMPLISFRISASDEVAETYNIFNDMVILLANQFGREGKYIAFLT